MHFPWQLRYQDEVGKKVLTSTFGDWQPMMLDNLLYTIQTTKAECWQTVLHSPSVHLVSALIPDYFLNDVRTAKRIRSLAPS